MKKILGTLIGVLVVIIAVAAIIGLEGLIFWGIGTFICWAFAIPFVFTFWHGCAVAIVFAIIRSIFQKNNNSIKED
jgi:hypothetical protein